MFEAKAYKILLGLERNGVICNLELQPKFILQNAFESIYYDGSVEKVKAGKLREITYVSDFLFEYKNQKIVLETKGMPDQKYPIKKKLFLNIYGKNYCFLEIRRVRELNKLIDILNILFTKKDEFDSKKMESSPTTENYWKVIHKGAESLLKKGQ